MINRFRDFAVAVREILSAVLVFIAIGFVWAVVLASTMNGEIQW